MRERREKSKTRERVDKEFVCEREWEQECKRECEKERGKSKVVLTKCFNEKNEAIKRLPKRMRICVANRMVRLSVE